jgi:LasA protease
VQPKLELPFLPGRVWGFTGGPHSAWGPDGALAAIDFAPPSSESGCVQSPEWVTAMAPGVIVRSVNGLVIEDLDGDGVEQTGWNIMYLHIETRDRVSVGTRVETNDKIGHPSCEGGKSSGTHTHVVRKYNGEWILAGGPMPFNLSGYIAHNGDAPYKGTLTLGTKTITADFLGSPETYIARPKQP